MSSNLRISSCFAEQTVRSQVCIYCHFTPTPNVWDTIPQNIYFVKFNSNVFFRSCVRVFITYKLQWVFVYLRVSEYICECVFVFTQAQRRSPQQMKSKMTGQHCSLSEHERERVCKILICSYLGYGGVVSLSLGSRRLMEESCYGKRIESKPLWQLPVAKRLEKLSLARSFSLIWGILV